MKSVLGALPLSYHRIKAVSRIRTYDLPLRMGCNSIWHLTCPYERHRARLCAVHQGAPYWNTRGVEPLLSGYDVVLKTGGVVGKDRQDIGDSCSTVELAPHKERSKGLEPLT